MKIKVQITARQAINYGRNETEYYCEIDVTTLPEEHRKFLSESINNSSQPELNNQKLLDDTGNITPESIGKAYDDEKERSKKELDKTVKNAREALSKLKKGEVAYFEIRHRFDHDTDHYKLLTQQDTKELYALRNEATQVKEKLEAEENRKRDAFLVEYEKKVVEYENGGEYPINESGYDIPQELDNRRSSRSEVVKKQKDAEREKEREKLDSEIVEKYGTDIQKRRHKAGFMGHTDVFNILWANVFGNDNPVQTDSCKTEIVHNVVPESWWYKENFKELTDEQFVRLENVLSQYDEFEYTVLCEASDLEDDIPFVRLSTSAYGYDLEADFLL